MFLYDWNNEDDTQLVAVAVIVAIVAAAVVEATPSVPPSPVATVKKNTQHYR